MWRVMPFGACPLPPLPRVVEGMMGWLTVYRSAVEAWSKAAPGVAKWTKITVAQHITVGGLGATVVGTAEHVADEFERWVEEADVDGFNIVSTVYLACDCKAQ